MEITLTPEQERIVRHGMASGRYASREQLLGEALHLWSHHTHTGPSHDEAVQDEVALLLANRGSDAYDHGDAQAFPALNAALRAATESLDRGEGIPGEEVYEELKQRSTDRRTRR